MEVIENVAAFINDGTPTYMEAARSIRWGVEYCFENCTAVTNSYGPVDFFSTLASFGTFDVVDIVRVLGLVLLWTLARHILNPIFFQPLARWLKLSKTNSWKFPESAWKLIVYTCTWSYSTYVIFGLERYNHIFYEPETLWDDYSPNLVIEPIVYWMYLMQLAFYIHSIYGTVFMDVWRADSAMMICHHFLTIFLISFSYIARFHKIGILVLWLHDISDVVLEFTKCNVYLKTRGGTYHWFNDLIASVGFVTFAVFWYLFRLFWYPLKVLYSAGFSAMVFYKSSPTLHFYFFFNVMLWLLQLLNIWWFSFIVIFIVKIITGQVNDVDDIREDENDREIRNKIDNGNKKEKQKRKIKKIN